jgi:lipopolysaccharide export system permease protein
MELLENRTPDNMGELLWRMGLPVMSLLLMLLAIPLGFVNPRAGRSANLLLALLLYVTYNNTVSFLQATVAQGKAAFGIAWWPMHLTVAMITLSLFLMRLNVNSRYHPQVIWSGLRHRKSSPPSVGEPSA